MIKIYDSADYNLIACLTNVMPNKAIIYKDSEEYYAELEIPHKYISESGRTEEYTSILKNDNIAVIKTPWGAQPFHLGSPEITPKGFTFKAQHVSRVLKRYAIPTLSYIYRPTLDTAAIETLNKSGANTLFTVDLQADPFAHYPEPFNFYFGNNNYIGTTYSASDAYTMTAFDTFKYISSVYNVQLDFDNWAVVIKEYPDATSSDIILRNAKNIDDIKIIENWDNVCTRCVAIGYRNLRAVYTAPSNPYAYNYDRVVEFELSLGVDKENDDAVIADLLYQAQRYVQAHINPEITYTIKAAPGVDVNIGDPVIIKYSNFINLTAKIASVKYNALTGQYEAVEFGNTKSAIKGFKTEVSKQLNNFKLRIGQGGL